MALKLPDMNERQLWAKKSKLIDEKSKLDLKVDILIAKITEVNQEQVNRFMKRIRWNKKTIKKLEGKK